MRRAIVVMVLLGAASALGACASSHSASTDQQAPPTDNSTPEPDRENIRNVLRERPN